MPTIPQVPPPPHNRENPNGSKKGAPLWEILAASAVAIGTLGLLIVNIFLLGSTKNAADSAQQQTTLLRQQMEGTYAAAIPKETPFPSPISSDLAFLSYMGINLSFRNVGKVKATAFLADATLTRQSLPRYQTIGTPEHKQITKSQMRPYDQTGPQAIVDIAALRFDTTMFKESDIRALGNLEEVIQIEGHFQYDDGFGHTVREPICYLYAVIPQHVFANAATGGGPGGWYLCDDTKSVIAQALALKKEQK